MLYFAELASAGYIVFYSLMKLVILYSVDWV